MSLFKVIVFLFLVSITVVDTRPLRQRRQEVRSSAYYGGNGLSNSQYLGYALSLAGFGNNLSPIGNNWYVPNYQPYPNMNPYGYNMQPQPYVGTNEYPNVYNTYWTGQNGIVPFTGQFPSNSQAYVGQSYMPINNEWLPLPGVNRRQQLHGDTMNSNTDSNPSHPPNK